MHYPEWVLERAFGGSDVAETPGASAMHSKWAAGQSMPAAREATDLLVHACNGGYKGGSVMLFLVGGAGNGKSHLARHVANSVRGAMRPLPGVHAHRVYEIDLDGGGYLRLVNDATIPPDGQWESGGNALQADLEAALKEGGHLLCCVNRGVLVREAPGPDAPAALAAAILAWLAAGESRAGLLPKEWDFVAAKSGPNRDHYAFAAATSESGERVNVHVVFMDNASLLEPFAPTIEGTNPESALEASPRTVERLLKGTGKSRMAVTAFSATVTAFREVIELADQQHPELDPVLANAQMLSSPAVASAWTAIARGAEIIAGTHLTYRDLWGLVSLSLTGVLQGRSMAEHSVWVEGRVAAAVAGTTSERLDAVLSLGTLRTHQAMFACRLPDVLSAGIAVRLSYPSVQALRSMVLADPVRALHPDVRRSVSEKMFLLEEGAGPGCTLAEQDEAFARCWTPFDQALENTIVSWLNGDGEAEEGQASSRADVSKRRAVVAWYGEYMARHASVSRGLPAFPVLVDLWQRTWVDAPDISDELENGLLNLAFPIEGGKSLLPVFDERIVPASETNSAGRILVQVKQKDYRVTARTEGDRVIVLLGHDDAERKTPLLLDFNLLRETIARNDGAGFTDAMFDVEPRVERLRAAGMMLEVAADLSKLKKRLAFSAGDTVISAGGG